MSTDEKGPERHWLYSFQHLYMHVVLAFYGPSLTLNYGILKNLQHSDLMADALFKKA